MEADRQSARAFGVQCPQDRRGSAGSFSHLRPLSSYSRKIVCDSADGWPGFDRKLPASFCNLKVEIVNSAARAGAKRRLDEAALEEGHGAPLRKRLALDPPASGSGAGRGGLSSERRAPPSPVRPPNAPRSTAVRKEGWGAGLGRPASGREAGSGGADEAVSRAVAPTPLPRPGSPARTQTPGELDADHAFDFDIEDILSLSPIGGGESDDSEGIEAFIESCHSFYESSCVSSPTGPAHSPSGPAPFTSSPAHSPSGPTPSISSPAHIPSFPAHIPSGHAPSTSSPTHTPSFPAHIPSGHAPSTSSPAHTPSFPAHIPSGHAQGARLGGKVGGDSGKGAVSFDEGYFSRRGEPPPEIKARLLQSSPLALAKGLKLSNLQQASVDGGGALPSPAPVDGPAVCRNLLALLDDGPQPGATGELRGGFEGGRGAPSFSGGGLKVGVAVEKHRPSPRDMNTAFLADFGEPPAKLFRGPALPAVQVRSVVVVPRKRTSPGDVQSGRDQIKRPVVFHDEAVWQREKELYVAAVTSHMENGAPRGAMTELVNLMRTVARQGTSDGNRPWQHPSDLTRRNLRPAAGKALLSLDEWERRSGKAGRRFAAVPAKFHRSPAP